MVINTNTIPDHSEIDKHKKVTTHLKLTLMIDSKTGKKKIKNLCFNKLNLQYQPLSTEINNFSTTTTSYQEDKTEKQSVNKWMKMRAKTLTKKA